MKKILSIMLVLATLFTLVACGTKDAGADKSGNDLKNESDFSYVKSNGKIVIGYTDYAPMNYTDESGTFTGFDTELATLVCEKLGLEPEFVEINWDTKEVELNAKSIDCIWNGLTIDEDRKATMEITKPYIKNAQVVLVKEGTVYESTASLIGKTVAAEQGSAGEKIVKEDENLKQAIFIPKTLQTECLVEVKAGTADAAVLDLTLANTMTGEGTNYKDILIVDHLAEENYGVAFRKGSDLCAEVNKIFDEFVSDGTMEKLAKKYGLDLAD